MNLNTSQLHQCRFIISERVQHLRPQSQTNPFSIISNLGLIHGDGTKQKKNSRTYDEDGCLLGYSTAQSGRQ